MPTYIFSKHAYAPHITISSTPTQCHYDIPHCLMRSEQERDQEAGRKALPACVYGRVACQNSLVEHCAVTRPVVTS